MQLNIDLEGVDLTNLEDPAALAQWALGFASDSVRAGWHDADLDGSDRDLIADALMMMAQRLHT